MPIEVPRPLHAALQEAGARLVESRKAGGDLKSVARELLLGAYDTCARAGLDRVLDDLAAAHPDLDVSDRHSLADHPGLAAALVAQLATIDLDGGGPRNAKPRQLADCVTAALGLTLVDYPDRSIALDDSVRIEAVAAMAAVVESELAIPAIRAVMISEARARCDAFAQAAFDKVAEYLDERGLRLVRQPKIPIDQMQAIQHALYAARTALVTRVARFALNRAAEVLGRANPEAAARLDQPITKRSTPREVALLRALDSRVGAVPGPLVASLAGSITDLIPIAWGAPVLPVHTYAASKTFAIGDLIEHPKFGRGKVTGALMNRIDVEFPDGKVTLVHVPPRR